MVTLGKVTEDKNLMNTGSVVRRCLLKVRSVSVVFWCTTLHQNLRHPVAVLTLETRKS